MKYLILLLALGCSTNTPVYEPNPLVKQVLKVRSGHAGLTNSRCLVYKGKDCQKTEIRDYLLSDPEFRKLANDLNFRCTIAGKRYKICLDKEGFCRFWYVRSGLFGKKIQEHFIPINPIEYHLSSNTKCASNFR